MIHGAGNYSYGCKVLGKFGTKYAASHPDKDRVSNTINIKKFQEKQENHTIINNIVDELCMVESKNVSAVNHEAPEFLESDYNENYLY